MGLSFLQSTRSTANVEDYCIQNMENNDTKLEIAIDESDIPSLSSPNDQNSKQNSRYFPTFRKSLTPKEKQYIHRYIESLKPKSPEKET